MSQSIESSLGLKDRALAFHVVHARMCARIQYYMYRAGVHGLCCSIIKKLS